MKTYKMIVNGETNDYVRGRISGMIYVFTGMPELTYGWAPVRGDKHWMTKVFATEKQISAITDCINEAYPDVILQLIKETE